MSRRFQIRHKTRSTLRCIQAHGYHRRPFITLNATLPIIARCSLRRHTLPQLPLPLARLQLQPTDGITQPLLLLPQLLHLHLLHIGQRAILGSSDAGILLPITRPRRLRQPSLLQFRFGDEGLFAALEFVQVGLYAREQGGDFGLDFGEEGGLGRCEVVFGD